MPRGHGAIWLREPCVGLDIPSGWGAKICNCQGPGLFPSFICGTAQRYSCLTNLSTWPTDSSSYIFFLLSRFGERSVVLRWFMIRSEDVGTSLTSQPRTSEVASHWKPVKRPDYTTVTREEESDFQKPVHVKTESVHQGSQQHCLQSPEGRPRCPWTKDFSRIGFMCKREVT